MPFEERPGPSGSTRPILPNRLPQAPFGDAVTPSAKRREYSAAELAGVCMICAGLVFGSLGEVLSMSLGIHMAEKVSTGVDTIDSRVTSREDAGREVGKMSQVIEDAKTSMRNTILVHRLALVGRVGLWVCLAGIAVFMLAWRSAERE